MEDVVNTSRRVRNAARIAGILFLLQMVAAVISHSVILSPILRHEHFLAGIQEQETNVRIAMLLDLVTGASVFGIAVLLFPILKKYNESIALWYVGLRLNEFVAAVIGGALLLTVLAVGKEYAEGDAAAYDNLEILAKYLIEARGLTKVLMLLGFCLSASPFYYLLLTSRLVPRFLSLWGLAGVALLAIEIVSNIFGRSAGGIMIMVPMGLNEIFLGVWLIVKGFNVNAQGGAKRE